MIFTFLGLISAMLFGVFFGSEGELAKETQETVFWTLILSGVALHALQIAFESLRKSGHCPFCHHH